MVRIKENLPDARNKKELKPEISLNCHHGSTKFLIQNLAIKILISTWVQFYGIRCFFGSESYYTVPFLKLSLISKIGTRKTSPH